jgi:hypothetical protein
VIVGSYWIDLYKQSHRFRVTSALRFPSKVPLDARLATTDTAEGADLKLPTIIFLVEFINTCRGGQPPLLQIQHCEVNCYSAFYCFVIYLGRCYLFACHA